MSHHAAVLLLDLQVDFLDTVKGKMPVDADGALRVVAAANEVLAGKALAGALPVLIVSQFPANANIANWFRHGAAVSGSAGAELDPRIRAAPSVRVLPKRESNAFSNPELEPYLRQQNAGRLWVMGVFAEGCVRATALAGRRLGFDVVVPEAGIATNAAWKSGFARWALRGGGVNVVPTFHAEPSIT